MASEIVVLDGYTLNPGDISWSGFEALGQTTVYDRTSPEETIKRASGFEYVLTNKTVLSREVLSELPDVKYIGVLATGYDNVDILAAREQQIAVTNIPTYGTDSVAQHATALLMELVRQPALHATAVRNGKWSESPDFCFSLSPISELSGKTLGIIGIGRIGQAFARIGKAMGMNILAHDEFPPAEAAVSDLEVEFTDMDSVFKRADIISLHCPLTDKTKHLVNSSRLSIMKTDSLLINTSRGPLVDNEALANALNTGQIGGAGLDVLDVEPPPIDNPLLTAANCLITPHISWYSKASRERLMDIAVKNLENYISGKSTNVIN
ncbi:MAG: D-2-hydroxyacid dehydrogenase [Chloroflexota bacterium]|nr:D-2-hydroxyacid dehydrogenase [Chloroflexota bacterium]